MKTAINIKYQRLKNNKGILQEIKDAGFDGIDFVLPTFDTEEERTQFLFYCEDLRKELDKYHLVCSQVHLPFPSLFLSSEIADERVDQNIINGFSAMNILGCPWGAYHPRSSTNFGYDPVRAMEDNKKEIGRYLEEAVKRNVGIALENIPIFPDCPQYRFFSADYEDHMELVDSFSSDKVGVCWDFGHANLMGYDMKKVITKMGHRIKILHVHDNYRTGDLHLVPMNGTIDWNILIPVLKNTGYTGALSLELNWNIPKNYNSFLRYCADVAQEIAQIS